MEENVAIAPILSPAISAEVESTQIIEEGPRVCPLCSSEIRFFFINFNEKMLMCENIECEFPFGYEDLQFVRFENEEDMSDVISIRTKRTHISPVATGSVISTASWSEIDKINRVYDSEDSQLEQRSYDIQSQKEKRKNKKNTKDSEFLIQKHVEDIKGLNMELMEISETNKIIKNERWIKNLMTLQGKSGVKLLKPEELKQVKKDNKDIKINIDTGNSSNISTIKIQIAETDV
ncbi:uncharacterized protein LOC113395174 [Vanessa tameamea]|uniref:Uncharacterized protein LOC113395174 n=1 Tax=Vanessa tameamea TaxID=334116 RepID=A0A8B8HUJ5_VANTA|nr:uncharacterized protein LOC113395174 [Vanessa tameamea]